MLLLADTHLGFDAPTRPRVERPRRGPDFFANTRAALDHARPGEVDLVVHGGDLLYRSRVPPQLVLDAFAPLREVAERGIPVVLVPGNHERSAIPYPLLVAHRGIHVLDRPRSVSLTLRGRRVLLAGFPNARRQIRRDFAELLAATGWRDEGCDIRLLCVHEAVEGSRVGPSNFTFLPGEDVLPGRAIPAGFAAVLAGHIHRHQVLEHDLAGRPLAAPVFYPGSIERTSFAERGETKGFLTLTLEANEDGGRVESATFHRLATRPMVALEPRECAGIESPEALRATFDALAPDAVVRLDPSALGGALATLSGAALRGLAGPNRILDLARPRR